MWALPGFCGRTPVALAFLHDWMWLLRATMFNCCIKTDLGRGYVAFFQAALGALLGVPKGL